MSSKELLQQWVDALRSDDYQQIKSHLHRDEGYCCLGVLCEIAGEEWHQNMENTEEFLTVYYVEGEESVRMADYPPEHVLEKAEITMDFCKKLAHYNDEGYTFNYIANMIEEEKLS